MKLFNTLSRLTEEFKPISDTINMYVCGLTPYDSAHVGHARTYVAFDLLKRYLIYKGYKVFHIQNITDVDDKILRRSAQLNINPLDLANKYHNEALELFDKLNIIRADVYPKVSDHIKDIVDFVKHLQDKGYAYETPTGIYFSVKSFPSYGKLSHQDIDEIRKNHRIKPDPHKHDPIDFALWKKTKPGEEPIGFDTPLGYGRPGWHIECSTMSLKYIKGNTLDIHGGAKDLIFPHHENEIAQSEAYTGERFVNYWVHTGVLTVNGVKMSKSLGNFITLKEALSNYDANVLRYFFVSKKYSSSLDWSEKAIEDAAKALKRITSFYLSLYSYIPFNVDNALNKLEEYRNNFFKALDNDLDTPKALSYLFNAINAFNILYEKKAVGIASLQFMKLFMHEFSFIFGIKISSLISNKEKSLLELIINIRNQLREKKLYNLSDEIRDKLSKEGILLQDKGDKTFYTFGK